ncbi:hypothetical protein V8C26DRAFT_181776 [Trichoderma gracile]
MEDLLQHIRPALLAEEDRQWEWDWKKFYLQPEVLSRDLHDRFNRHTLPIRRPDVFQREVEGCIELAATEEEFLAKLEQRKSQHVQEVMRAWRSICAVIESNSWLLVSENMGDTQDADKEDGDNGNGGKGDDTKDGSGEHRNVATENDDSAADSSASPQLGPATSSDLPMFYLDDITSQHREGRKRWAKETCAGILMQRRSQRIVAPTASDRTTAEMTAPYSLFCAGIWDPDGLLPSGDLSERQFLRQYEVQPAKPAPVADPPSVNPLKRPLDCYQEVVSEQSIGVTEAEFIAPTVIENLGEEDSGLTKCAEPAPDMPTIDSVVREVSPSISSREPMDLDASEDDDDVVMTDAALAEHPAPGRPRMAPRGSRRQDKHRAMDGKLSRGKRSTPLTQQQQSRVKKKQSRRRPSQGTKSPALLDRLLRSTRSTRRDSGHELWYLADDATACRVTNAG